LYQGTTLVVPQVPQNQSGLYRLRKNPPLFFRLELIAALDMGGRFLLESDEKSASYLC
jgi:hypothetical protein